MCLWFQNETKRIGIEVADDKNHGCENMGREGFGWPGHISFYHEHVALAMREPPECCPVWFTKASGVLGSRYTSESKSHSPLGRVQTVGATR